MNKKERERLSVLIVHIPAAYDAKAAAAMRTRILNTFASIIIFKKIYIYFFLILNFFFREGFPLPPSLPNVFFLKFIVYIYSIVKIYVVS